MGKQLTISQLLEKLKPGEIAKECVKTPSNKVFYITISEGGNALYCKRDGQIDSNYGSNGFVVLTHWLLNSTWEIIHMYVDFATAMKAVQEGKKVIVHYEGYEEEPSGNWDEFTLNSGLHEDTTFNKLIKGKWIIVEN